MDTKLIIAIIIDCDEDEIKQSDVITVGENNYVTYCIDLVDLNQKQVRNLMRLKNFYAFTVCRCCGRLGIVLNN